MEGESLVVCVHQVGATCQAYASQAREAEKVIPNKHEQTINTPSSNQLANVFTQACWHLPTRQ
jgi:hypothetical protein